MAKPFKTIRAAGASRQALIEIKAGAHQTSEAPVLLKKAQVLLIIEVAAATVVAVDQRVVDRAVAEDDNL